METLKFTVPGVFPSLNALNKMHWGSRHKLRKEIDWMILTVLPDIPFPQEKIKRICAIDILIYQPFRKLDDTNADGSMKAMIDALVAFGLLFRDSPKWLKKTITQEIDRKNPRLEITIQQLEEAK